MSEQLLDLLKLCLLALLYLFFLRVMWVVWTELRAPEPAPVGATRPRRAAASGPAARPRRRKQRRQLDGLTVIEPADRAGHRYALADEMTLGRSPGCAIVVDDTFVSQLHARVYADGGGYRVEDLGSTNGTLHNGAPLTGSAPLRRGDRVQVGNTVLELT